MKSGIIAGILFLLTFLGYYLGPEKPYPSWESQTVGEVLIDLKDPAIIPHLPDTSLRGVSVERGRELVLEGRTTKPGGGKTRRVSAYFECTACHNIVAESDHPAELDPAKRLLYAEKNNIPYLPGSPLYGIVSRTSFYNGDYEKKYGELVENARNNLRGAIQLCATECSQGRALEDWEMESVLAYLWTIDIPISELKLSAAQKEKIKEELNQGKIATESISILQSNYVIAYPATFVDPPKDRVAGNGLEGDVDRGKLFYTQSCMHCHGDARYSLFELDTTVFTMRQLANRMPTYHEESVYQVSRYGTSPLLGKGAYMPNYTLEKMSEQQLADLRAYIMQYQ